MFGAPVDQSRVVLAEQHRVEDLFTWKRKRNDEPLAKIAALACWCVCACVCVCARLTGLRVEPAGVEEVGCEVDVDVAEEEQHVASLPGPGADVQAPSSRELLVQLQQSVVFKMHFPAVTHTHTYKEGI